MLTRQHKYFSTPRLVPGSNGCVPFFRGGWGSWKFLHLAEKLRKFRNINFPEYPLGNCGLPPHLLNFPVSSLSSAENNSGKSKLVQMVSAISFVCLLILKKTLTIIQRSPQSVYSYKWWAPNSYHKTTLQSEGKYSITHSLTQSYLQSLRYPRPLDKNNEGSGNGIGRLSVTARNTSHVCVRKPRTGHPRRPRSYLPGWWDVYGRAMFSVSPVSPPLFYEILESLTRDEKFSGHFLEEFLSKNVAVYCALGGGLPLISDMCLPWRVL